MEFLELKEKIHSHGLKIRISSDRERLIVENPKRDFNDNIVMTVSAKGQYINNSTSAFEELDDVKKRDIVKAIAEYIKEPKKNIDYGYVIEVEWVLGLDLSDSPVFVGLEQNKLNEQKSYFSDYEILVSIEELEYMKNNGVPLESLSVYKATETAKEKIYNIEELF